MSAYANVVIWLKPMLCYLAGDSIKKQNSSHALSVRATTYYYYYYDYDYYYYDYYYYYYFCYYC